MQKFYTQDFVRKVLLLCITTLLIGIHPADAKQEPDDSEIFNDLDDVIREQPTSEPIPQKKVAPTTAKKKTAPTSDSSDLDSTIEGTESAPAQPTVSETQPVPRDLGPIARESTLPSTDLSTFAREFSSEKAPGEGTLTFRMGSKSSTIQLGKESGFFGLAIAFQKTLLPQHVRSEFESHDIIQIVLGTSPSKRQDRAPEFGHITVFSPGKPRTVQAVPFLTSRRGVETPRAMAIVTDPLAKALTSDGDRLKGTWFAKSGEVRVQILGPTQGLNVKAGGSTLSLDSQVLRVEFNAELGSPFAPEKGQIEGSLLVPIFWPESPTAKNWVKGALSKAFLQPSAIASKRLSTSKHSAEADAEASPDNDGATKRDLSTSSRLAPAVPFPQKKQKPRSSAGMR